MARKALIEIATGRLLEHGFVDYEPTEGQTVMDVPEDFSQQPGATKFDGKNWAPYTPPPPTDAEKTATLAAEFEAQKTLKALAIWAAQKLGVTPAAALSEILAIRKGL